MFEMFIRISYPIDNDKYKFRDFWVINKTNKHFPVNDVPVYHLHNRIIKCKDIREIGMLL